MERRRLQQNRFLLGVLFLGTFTLLYIFRTLQLLTELRKWWHKEVVLGGAVYISHNGRQMNEHIVYGPVKEIPDFEYAYPPSDRYAFVWTSTNELESCAALSSMLLVQSYFENSSLPLEYILLSTVNLENTLVKHLWESGRGIVEVVSPGRLNWIDQNSALKHVATQLFSTWIILVDPRGVPLRKLRNTLEKLTSGKFFSTTNSFIVGYPLVKDYVYWPMTCQEGNPSRPIDTHLLFLQPSRLIYNRLTFYETTNLDFGESINREFSCNQESFVFETVSVLSDIELAQQEMEVNVAEEMDFISFDELEVVLKPDYNGEMLNKMSTGAQKYIRRWIHDLLYVCDGYL